MRNAFIYLIVSLLLFSCYTDDIIPASVIRPKEMKSILWDVMRAQTLAQETSLKDTTVSVPVETNVLSKKIFKIHHTDSTHFVDSYNWYVKHPAVLKVIFDSLYIQKQRESETNLNKNETPLHPPVKHNSQ